MADYAAVHMYADQITGRASAAITGRQSLVVTGDGTVGPSSGVSAAFVGVAAQDAASGADVSYFPRGKVHEAVAPSGGITAGAQLATAASGGVDDIAAASGNAAADINNARSIVGVALTTAAQGETYEWMQFG